MNCYEIPKALILGMNDLVNAPVFRGLRIKIQSFACGTIVIVVPDTHDTVGS